MFGVCFFDWFEKKFGFFYIIIKYDKWLILVIKILILKSFIKGIWKFIFNYEKLYLKKDYVYV